jgi:uncharacterized protein YjbI with pentapeptide repeats
MASGRGEPDLNQEFCEMKKAELKKRWNIFSDSEEVFRKTRKFSVSPFGRTEEGLLDFRGLPLTSSLIIENDPGAGWCSEAHRADISDADFSESSWQGFDLEHSTLERCRFSKAKFVGNLFFRETCFTGCVFEDCSFRDVRFVDSKIEKTHFRKLKVKTSKQLNFIAAKIDGCSFEGTMRKISFSMGAVSSISHTSFSGTLTDCTFWGHPEVILLDAEKGIYGKIPPSEVDNRMDGVDFSKASLILCSISNSYCYLDKVIPPAPENNCIALLNAAFYDRLTDLLTQEMPPALAEEAVSFTELFFKPHVCTPYGVMGPHDFVKDFGEDGARRFYELFLRAAIETGVKV